MSLALRSSSSSSVSRPTVRAMAMPTAVAKAKATVGARTGRDRPEERTVRVTASAEPTVTATQLVSAPRRPASSAPSTTTSADRGARIGRGSNEYRAMNATARTASAASAHEANDPDDRSLGKSCAQASSARTRVSDRAVGCTKPAAGWPAGA